MELSINNLSKKIGNRLILDGLSLTLNSGDILALRGGNGSGKTTLLNLIAGVDRDFSGEIKYAEKTGIGFVPQDIVLFEKLSVKDNLKIFCNSSNRTDIIDIAEKLGFCDLLKKRVFKLSGGQKRLINFAVGVINKSDILLLDEVIVGMDEELVKRIESYIREIGDKKIIIITSHQENFLQEVCNKSACLMGGKLELKDEN